MRPSPPYQKNFRKSLANRDSLGGVSDVVMLCTERLANEGSMIRKRKAVFFIFSHQMSSAHIFGHQTAITCTGTLSTGTKQIGVMAQADIGISEEPLGDSLLKTADKTCVESNVRD